MACWSRGSLSCRCRDFVHDSDLQCGRLSFLGSVLLLRLLLRLRRLLLLRLGGRFRRGGE